MVEDRAGSQFGPYRLIRLLGSGGFGEVYEAEDTAMNRVVALKLLSNTYSQDPVFRERLFREARTAGRLREPHVLPIHSCGEIEGQVYIDMRLVRGVDLETLLKRDGPLDPTRAVKLIRQVAAALDAAHAETVLHRDVKPANILLSGDDFASLVDFGLASAAGDARLTKTGKAVGTFDYVAPERLSEAPVDHRCDVYALACVLYELLTGKAPYEEHRDLSALMTAHLTAPIPRPSQQRPGIPAALDDVIARGMAKNPDARYRSAGELAQAAENALNPAAATREWGIEAPAPPIPHVPPPLPPPSAPRPPWAQPPDRKRRHRVVYVVAAIALVAVAITVGIVAIVHRHDGARPAAASTPRPSSTVPTVLKFPNLVKPRGVAVDEAGNVYVAELTNHSPEGRVLKLPAAQSAPTELAFGEVYGLDVAADNDGNVYLADIHAPGVWKLAPGARGPILLPFGHVGRPAGLAVGKDGSVYLTDNALKQVLKLAPGATSAIQLMPTVPMSGPGGVAVDKDGNLYIADSDDRRVLKLPVGAATPTELPFAGLQAPYGVAVDPGGNVYVSDLEGHGIFRLAAGATSATRLAFPGLNYPLGIAVDKDGDLFVVDCHRTDDCATGKVLELGPPR
ncbi:serine/threonine-protein kinase PknD [Mycobacterium sp. 23]|uniref:serine/threonine-protein kinase PknD n=1 Tax=Mycobacterium sp. 23 TaxID=3400424 RepID=UPI003AB0DD57